MNPTDSNIGSISPEDNQKALKWLVWSARQSTRYHYSFREWQDNVAEQWALDNVTQQQLNAIGSFVFGENV